VPKNLPQVILHFFQRCATVVDMEQGKFVIFLTFIAWQINLAHQQQQQVSCSSKSGASSVDDSIKLSEF
jgi:hypothetical protein